MRIAFHVELDRLLGDLARMTRLTGQMTTNASIALHQTDRALATLVDAEHEQLNMALTDVQRRCVNLLALQAPVARDLRVVIAAVRALGHVQRMGSLARHVAVMARFIAQQACYTATGRISEPTTMQSTSSPIPLSP